MRHRLLIFLSAAAALALGPTIVILPEARADTKLISADPADGATTAGPLERVRLVFLEPLSNDATFAVVSPSGARVEDSFATEPQEPAGFPVAIRLKLLPDPGRYRVQYYTVARDGMPLRGEITFQYTGSGEASNGGLPVIPLLGAGMVLLCSTIVIVIVRRRAASAPAVPPTAEHCSNCGTTTTPGQRFCTVCGTRLQ